GHLLAIHALCAALDRHLGVAGAAPRRRPMSPAARPGVPAPPAPVPPDRPSGDGQPQPGPAPAPRPGERPRPHIVVVGDVLLDADIDGDVERLCPDSPAPVLDVRATRYSPGGAGLAALLCEGRVT